MDKKLLLDSIRNREEIISNPEKYRLDTEEKLQKCKDGLIYIKSLLKDSKC